MFQVFQEQSQPRRHYARVSVFDKQELYIAEHWSNACSAIPDFTILESPVARERFVLPYSNISSLWLQIFQEKGITVLPLQHTFSLCLKVVAQISISSAIVTMTPEHQSL